MARFPKDIFTEPDSDPDTLANLGPLTGMAGIWEGKKGSDDHPVAEGTETDAYLERYELHPIDPQTNGPQLLYGLRYHVHIEKPALGAGHEDRLPDPRHPPRPGGHGLGEGPG
jgi:hypothetical protein